MSTQLIIFDWKPDDNIETYMRLDILICIFKIALDYAQNDKVHFNSNLCATKLLVQSADDYRMMTLLNSEAEPLVLFDTIKKKIYIHYEQTTDAYLNVKELYVKNQN